MNTTTKNNYNILDIALTGMMAALVFVGTYFFKIPTTFGYTHLGDCMIVLTVCLLGTRKGMLAGAIGAGLSDLLGGYMIWVVPTMLFKSMWAVIMGLIAYKLLTNWKYSWVVGAIAGGVVHILLYTLFKIPMFGTAYALSTVPSLTGQTICGIAFGAILYSVLKDIPGIKKYRTQNI